MRNGLLPSRESALDTLDLLELLYLCTTVHLGNSKLSLLCKSQLLSISINRKTENITL